MDFQIFSEVDKYIRDLFGSVDEALIQAEKSLEEAGMPKIQVSANQGKMLQAFAKMCQAKNILEIGTLSGYSTIWLARALPEQGKLITIELEKSYAEVAQKNIDLAGLTSKVEIRVGKALEVLAQIQTEGLVFDLIFIDADKEPYAEYFEWAVKLSHQGTVIIADNVIREGKVLNQNSDDSRVLGVQRFNQMLAKHPNITATIIQMIGVKDYDGMAIAVIN
jgi:caffeoyl-CoA O-methyltransferase